MARVTKTCPRYRQTPMAQRDKAKSVFPNKSVCLDPVTLNTYFYAEVMLKSDKWMLVTWRV